MNAYIINLGIISIKWYSFLMLIAIFLAVTIFMKNSSREGFEHKFSNDLLFNTIIFGIIGARLYYVIFNMDYYAKDWLAIIKVWEGGLAIHGAIFAGLGYIFYYCKKYNQEFLKITDILSLSLFLGQAIGRWGNFFNQEAYGQITTSFNLEKLYIPKFIIEGMNIGGVYYQPTFLYESLWCFLGFVIVYIMKKQQKLMVGVLTCFYFIWYGTGRFIIEIFRSDSLSIAGIKAAQVVSIIFIVIGMAGLLLIKNNSKILIYLNNVNRWKK